MGNYGEKEVAIELPPSFPILAFKLQAAELLSISEENIIIS